MNTSKSQDAIETVRASVLTASLLCFISLSGIEQHNLTKGEVFNFEIGNVFHSSYEYGMGHPPNAKRYTILDRYDSADEDTVRYSVYLSGYSSRYGETMEDLIYTFREDTITWTYTDLDSLIFNYPDSVPNIDSVIYISKPDLPQGHS